MAHVLSGGCLPRGPYLVVSPHYDDAVFSCGNLLATLQGAVVLTVYTGIPEDAGMLTDWDDRCGFRTAAEAMGARAQENERALGLLQAQSASLGFLDSQYAQGAGPGADLLADTLTATIAQMRPAAVFSPLGLFHADHIQVSDALVAVCNRFSGIEWFAYADIPYRNHSRRVLERLVMLEQKGMAAIPLPVNDTAATRKAAAAAAYRSQYRGLGYTDGQDILRGPEQYWRLRPCLA